MPDHFDITIAIALVGLMILLHVRGTRGLGAHLAGSERGQARGRRDRIRRVVMPAFASPKCSLDRLQEERVT